MVRVGGREEDGEGRRGREGEAETLERVYRCKSLGSLCSCHVPPLHSQPLNSHTLTGNKAVCAVV